MLAEFIQRNHSKLILSVIVTTLVTSCTESGQNAVPTLYWYVFNERSGAFQTATKLCSEAAEGRYKIQFMPLPADADQQREQLVRRLAAKDNAIDIIGMDVIWTAEFAEAKWLLPIPESAAERLKSDRISATLQSATYKDQLWAIPFTTNTQMLWYRNDRIDKPPSTWSEMLQQAEAIGKVGAIQAQGERYEGFTVFFVSLLASAGGQVLSEEGDEVSLEKEPTLKTLEIMARFANSSVADPALATSRENQARLAFETGNSTFMLNYTFVWPSANANAPSIAKHMAWTDWPRVKADTPSRVTIGGINLGVSAYSKYPKFAFEAANCIASEANQRTAAAVGGMPPTISKLFDDEEVRETFPFADTLRETLSRSVQRPQTPLYNDVSLAISRTLHPMRDIEPQRDYVRLKDAVHRALNLEGLL